MKNKEVTDDIIRGLIESEAALTMRDNAFEAFGKEIILLDDNLHNKITQGMKDNRFIRSQFDDSFFQGGTTIYDWHWPFDELIKLQTITKLAALTFKQEDDAILYWYSSPWLNPGMPSISSTRPTLAQTAEIVASDKFVSKYGKCKELKLVLEDPIYIGS